MPFIKSQHDIDYISIVIESILIERPAAREEYFSIKWLRLYLLMRTLK